jgi:hypothetical protein
VNAEALVEQFCWKMDTVAEVTLPSVNVIACAVEP